MALVLQPPPSIPALFTRTSRRPNRSSIVLMHASMLAARPALIYFALDLMLNGSSTEFMLGQFLLGVPLGMALGLQGAMVVEIFPLRTAF